MISPYESSAFGTCRRDASPPEEVTNLTTAGDSVAQTRAEYSSRAWPRKGERVEGLGFRGLGFRGLGFRGLGLRVYRGWGMLS